MPLPSINIRAGIIASFFSIIAGVFGGYYWFESRLHSEIDKKIEPYKKLMAGISLVNYSDYENGALLLGHTIKEAIDNGEYDDLFLIYIDPYLDALIYCDNPSDQWPYFKVAVSISNEKMGLSAWRENSIGWIFLFMGKPDSAIKHFNHSVKLFGHSKNKSNDCCDNASISHWGLTISYLALGKSDSAFHHYQLAGEFSNNFSIRIFYSNKDKFKKTGWVDGISKMYFPAFEKSTDEFYVLIDQAMDKENEKKESTYWDSYGWYYDDFAFQIR